MTGKRESTQADFNSGEMTEEKEIAALVAEITGNKGAN